MSNTHSIPPLWASLDIPSEGDFQKHAIHKRAHCHYSSCEYRVVACDCSDGHKYYCATHLDEHIDNIEKAKGVIYLSLAVHTPQ